jgi:hypothetical protein
MWISVTPVVEFEGASCKQIIMCVKSCAIKIVFNPCVAFRIYHLISAAIIQIGKLGWIGCADYLVDHKWPQDIFNSIVIR